METFKVRVAREHLTFSSAHFIVLPGGDCEGLHGHDFRVSAEVEGPLDAHYLVLDFEALDDILRDIIGKLDHKVLLPGESRELQIEETKESVSVSFRERRWVFPREECVLLPVPSTTAELLARWISIRLREKLQAGSSSRLPPGALIRVEVREAPGQSAFHETRG